MPGVPVGFCLRFVNLKIICNYDATPAPDRDSADIKYLLGVGLNF